MPLLNYTTTVPVARSAARIQALLVKGGARGIGYTYEADGDLTGMSFIVRAAYGDQAYTLPANVERVRAVLLRQRVPARYSTVEHAARVAWRILQDWVAAQRDARRRWPSADRAPGARVDRGRAMTADEHAEDCYEPDDLAEAEAWRVGKKAAGRTLDGRTWDEFPACRSREDSTATGTPNQGGGSS